MTMHDSSSDRTGARLPAFDDAGLADALAALDDAAFDDLPFGVIGFGPDATVRRYNRRESAFSGLAPQRVIGRALFTEIAQCMNNYLVAQRFEDAIASGAVLDATMDFVLTWRMAPTPVRMRLLSSPAHDMHYVLIRHAG